jgi:glycosyltransferase involved in cell wall biosynthesis
VTHFVREVFPLILRERPAATFTAVGHRAPAEVQRLAGPNVMVTGWVDDVRPHLARAAVVAVPLRMGGGTRLKVLEALAMGKGVVTTSLGCEGLNVRHGEHLLVGDTPKAFADAVLYLLDRRDVAEELGSRGRQLVERSYGWAASVARLEAFYRNLIGHRERPALGASAQRPSQVRLDEEGISS